MSKKILLVEDNCPLAHALEIRLKSLGHNVAVADTISSAMSSLVSIQPDVTLIDINLPDGSGFCIAKQIENNNNIPLIPVIFMTASRNSRIREETKKYSPVAFLSKPFDVSDLIVAIEQAAYSMPRPQDTKSSHGSLK